MRLGLARTAPCARQRVETRADCPCGFHALCGPPGPSKALYHQLAKPHVAACARTMAARLLSAMTLQGLGCEQGRACGACRHRILQDGSALAIHDGWREGVPGRFKTLNPAAVARHTTMDVLCDAPTTVVLTPETASEQDKRRKAIHAQRPTRQRVALGGQWQGDGPPLGLRLILRWPPRPQRVCDCLPTLPPQRYPMEVICRAYQRRWHVE